MYKNQHLKPKNGEAVQISIEDFVLTVTSEELADLHKGVTLLFSPSNGGDVLVELSVE